MILGQYYINVTKHAKLPWTKLSFSSVKVKPWHKPYALLIGWGRFSLWVERDECGCRWSKECQECCEHSEYDHGICYDCGKDCTDDLAGAAEYLYEGER